LHYEIVTKTAIHILLGILIMLCSCANKVSPFVNENVAGDSLSKSALKFSLFTPDPTFVIADEAVSHFGPNGIIRDVLIDKNGIPRMAA
jgi:hypothetical protein